MVIKFITCHVNTTQVMLTVVFDPYLGAVASSKCDMLASWSEHAAAYLHCTAVTHRFLTIPASLATSKLVDK